VTPLDQLQFRFDPDAVRALNVVLATMVFGAALDVRIEDFRRSLVSPKGPAIGALTQFVLTPAIASLIVWLVQPAPSLGLGILLVAACPGGTVSNFMTMLARGNVALSLTVSAVSTLLAIVMTPVNFFFWAGLNPVTAGLLRTIEVDPREIVLATLYMLILPTFAALALRQWRGALADRLRRPARVVGVVLLIGFIAAGLAGNLPTASRVETSHVLAALGIVQLVNGAGLAVGYAASRLARLPHRDAVAVSLEGGFQNTGFGLVLVFQFFAGLGGMALAVGFWSVWHLISGLALALWWGRRHAAELGESPLQLQS
jgi:bile acid:Na+ symporter, BASS family